jgi:hypothetical protein
VSDRGAARRRGRGRAVRGDGRGIGTCPVRKGPCTATRAHIFTRARARLPTATAREDGGIIGARGRDTAA